MWKVLVAGLINILMSFLLWRKRKTPDRRLSEGEHLCFFFQKAFSAVQQLWGQRLPKEYGPHIAESMLSILYHIIKGEAVIKEKLGSAPESSGSTSSTSVPARPPEAAPQPEINMQHLQQVGKVQSNPVNTDTKGGHRKWAEVITLYLYQFTKCSCKVIKKISGRTNHNLYNFLMIFAGFTL